MGSAVSVGEYSGSCVLYELKSMDGGGAEGRIESVTVIKTGGYESMYNFFQVLSGEYGFDFCDVT